MQISFAKRSDSMKYMWIILHSHHSKGHYENHQHRFILLHSLGFLWHALITFNTKAIKSN